MKISEIAKQCDVVHEVVLNIKEKENWSTLANSPFSLGSYYVNEHGKAVIDFQELIKRLRLITDRFEITTMGDLIENESYVATWVQVKARILEEGITVKQLGVWHFRNPYIHIEKVDEAINDGIVKCLQLLGIGSHVEYVKVILPNRDQEMKATSNKYIQLLQQNGIQENSCYNGILVFPVTFRNWFDPEKELVIFEDNLKGTLASKNKDKESLAKSNFISEDEVTVIQNLIFQISPHIKKTDMIQTLITIFKRRNIDIHSELNDDVFDDVNKIPRNFYGLVINILQNLLRDGSKSK
ncbi:hypothetical protein [Brevibacillus laterosporus]|uniref:hypothetical protein n=1 Tax=Brevibacillus laterosporus TaxID=1465 RepID=UPI0003B1DE7D|nr:hypothetical protein [Brevibacillus laterosporus]ERM18909.1 hypothetical protein P615_01155 [Brevibacillus laterosporus PE36]